MSEITVLSPMAINRVAAREMAPHLTSLEGIAVVWQVDRIASGPWRTSGTEIMELIDAMIAERLDARRQAR